MYTPLERELPREAQETIIEKELKFYVIDAYTVGREAGMGTRVNTIMQTCFFAISGVLPRDEAIEKIKATIRKTYGKKGEEVVKRNFAAVDAALAHLHEVSVPAAVTAVRISASSSSVAAVVSKNGRPVRVRTAPVAPSSALNRDAAVPGSRVAMTIARDPMCLASHTTRSTPRFA